MRLFPAASVAVYWTSVSPTGNQEPGLWLLVNVRRPPKKGMYIYTTVLLVLQSHCRWQSWPFPIFHHDSFVRAKRLCSRKYAEMRTMSHLVAGKKRSVLGTGEGKSVKAD